MKILWLLVSYGFLLIAMSVHEFAHGWTAYKLGDNTAKYQGRLTLNPLAHIDLMGTVLLPLFIFISSGGRLIFGAAKPVPIDYRSFRNPHRDIMLVGLSGPLSNFIFAFILSLIVRVLPASYLLGGFLLNLILINVILGVFNLIPIPPLDGSRVLIGFLPPAAARAYASIEPYGFFIILFLVGFGLLNIWPAVDFILKLFVGGAAL